MRVDSTVAYPEGALTLTEVPAVLSAGERAMATGVVTFDFAGVTQVDSSALSLILSWQRKAAERSQSLTFCNIPDSLHSLARLYGVADLIP
jgi:phospholipid transport system transporter-binding protein